MSTPGLLGTVGKEGTLGLLVLLAFAPAVASGGCKDDCSSHGTCLDERLCLCNEGWVGANCSRFLKDWAAMHKLEHNFYEHDAFKSRYVLAAHHLRTCRNIIEVGGYRTPITGFLASQHESVTVVDPYIKPHISGTLNGAQCKVQHLPLLFEEYQLRGDEDCFVYIGLDYYDEGNNPLCEQLKAQVQNFRTVVIDYAGKYPTGAACFQALDLPSSFDRVSTLVLELEGNHWPDLSNSWLPTGLTTRVFYVLRNRNLPPESSVSPSRIFRSPQDYSGANAEDSHAAPPSGEAGGSVSAVGGHSVVRGVSAEGVLARAGGAVVSDEEEKGVRGWSLKGLAEKTKGGGEVQQAAGGEDGDEGEVEVEVPEVEDSFAAAMHHARKREWREAEAYWQRHQTRVGECHVAQYFDYGMAAFVGHRYKQAASLLRKVTEVAREDPRGYNNLALALESDGDLIGARQTLLEGLKYSPRHHGLNFNYAKLLLDDDNFQEAAARLAVATESETENLDIWFYLGTALRHMGRTDDSERAYNEITKRDPTYVFKYINTETNDRYHSFVDDEAQLLAEMTANTEGGGSVCDDAAATNTLCQLKAIVTELRAMESTLGFVGDRQLDGRKVQVSTGYMKHSFAYGSTFYQSWRRVFDNPVLQDGVAAARRGGRRYGVLGSSIGWHVFYGALTWQLPAVGWEILCSQVDISMSMVKAHIQGTASEGLVSFLCLDALQADLSDVHLLVLAFSRDVNLGAVLNHKLAADLAPGSLVVAWSRILDAQPEFERAAVYKVAVSWSDSWGMYVYRRR